MVAAAAASAFQREMKTRRKYVLYTFSIQLYKKRAKHQKLAEQEKENETKKGKWRTRLDGLQIY